MGSSKVVQKYNEDDLPASLKEIRAAIPAKFFVRDTRRGLLYLAPIIYKGALSPIGAELSRWAAWGVYWWFQGLIFTGIWVIGHECGHGAFSDHKWVNDIIGFVRYLISILRSTANSILRRSHTPSSGPRISAGRSPTTVTTATMLDGARRGLCPKTRSDLGIPEHHDGLDYEELLGDTPIYTLYMLIRQQVLAFPAYLLFNVSGQKTYPKWTNHFDRPTQRCIMSNLGIAAMVWGVSYSSSIWGASEVTKFYGIPWLCVSHWFIMITYLHHTDPVMPHYRGKEWNFQRGAAATVDRPVLGWQGRFLLTMLPTSTLSTTPRTRSHPTLESIHRDHYVTSDVPAFKALWENYNKCQFVEDEGDVCSTATGRDKPSAGPRMNTASNRRPNRY
ncbi:hypothetical protein BD779DRAFT_1672098 [Infundibulicybe gibba]|nr:hypothetical protein BD779DRAFT_1672098 [Infundibulicybe gibba]